MNPQVLIATDFLIDPTHQSLSMELMLQVFPQAEILCLAHQRGRVGGRVESRTIHSSFLSHRIKNKKQIKKNQFLIPSALNAMKIPSSVELIVFLSQGWIHGLECSCPRIDLKISQAKIQSKLFKKYLYRWLKLKKRDFIAIDPPARLADYPYISTEELTAIQNQILWMGEKWPTPDFENRVKSWCSSKNLEFVIQTRQEGKGISFSCEATQAKLFSHSVAVIDETANDFSEQGVGALAMGIPVLYSNSNKKRYFLEEGTLHYESSDELIQSLEKLFQGEWKMNRGQMRRTALKYNGRRFKSEFFDFLVLKYGDKKAKEWTQEK